jgi:hypothetical protein
MRFPASTGQVAALLRCTEPRLNDLIRRSKIRPAPSVSAGRRLWYEDQVRQAAEALDALNASVLAAIGEEVRP